MLGMPAHVHELVTLNNNVTGKHMSRPKGAGDSLRFPSLFLVFAQTWLSAGMAVTAPWTPPRCQGVSIRLHGLVSVSLEQCPWREERGKHARLPHLRSAKPYLRRDETVSLAGLAQGPWARWRCSTRTVFR
jgi:hypothetical protein